MNGSNYQCFIMRASSLMSKFSRRRRSGYGLLYCEYTLRFGNECCVNCNQSYKQNKFNLLREQSEGYSKLITELTASLGPPHSAATGRPTESLSAIEARAKPTWERVVGLVGYFDLDPNRALDIILDVFSTHLATHYSFFLALLACSPWAQAPKAKTEDPMNIETDSDMYRGKSFDDILRLAERQSSHEQPTSSGGPTDSRILAQVLGFKFTYYQVRVVRFHAYHMHLIRLLAARRDRAAAEEPIRPGRFADSGGVYYSGRPVSSRKYPAAGPRNIVSCSNQLRVYQLSLPDEDMDALHKKYLASVDTRIAEAKISQLAMAAPLESASSLGGPKPRPSTPLEPKKPQKEVPNQKLGVLNALLALGALRPACALMSKFPWIVDASPDLADLVLRIIRHSITPVYEAAAGTREALASFKIPKPRHGPTGPVPAPERKPLLTLGAPTPQCTYTTEFVFFYPDWTRCIPVCRTAADLPDVLEPLMSFIGLHIHRDPIFMSKCVRLARSQLSTTVRASYDFIALHLNIFHLLR